MCGCQVHGRTPRMMALPGMVDTPPAPDKIEMVDMPVGAAAKSLDALTATSPPSAATPARCRSLGGVTVLVVAGLLLLTLGRPSADPVVTDGIDRAVEVGLRPAVGGLPPAPVGAAHRKQGELAVGRQAPQPRQGSGAASGEGDSEAVQVVDNCTMAVTSHARALRYVAELPVAQSSVGYGRLGLGERLGFEGLRAKVKGKKYRHVVSMHPPYSGAGPAWALFEVPRPPEGLRWCAFKAEVAINDDNNFLGKAGSPLTFLVQQGSSVLWRSQPVQRTQQVQRVEVLLPPPEAAGVAEGAGQQQLRLSVQAAGSNACAHAVWVDPVLLA
jgi:hypothetical protein